MRISELIAVIFALAAILMLITLQDIQINKLDKRILILETKMEMKK
jgi:hypothetical protein